MKHAAAWWLPAGLVWLAASTLHAQSVTGRAEWVVDRHTTDFGGAKSYSRLFTQTYTVGYESILWDRRFMNYAGEITFLLRDQTIDQEKGDSNDFGYNLSAALFPERPFSFTINALRTASNYSGLFAGGDVQSGLLPIPAGFVPDRFTTELSTLNLGWQLTVQDWPQIRVGYLSSSVSTSTGPYEAVQDDRAFDLSVSKDWSRVRNILTFNSFSTDNIAVRLLSRSQDDLLYNLWADVTPKVRASARAGYRSLSNAFGVPPSVAGPGEPGRIPLAGVRDLTTRYVATSLSYLPARRLALDITVSYDDAGAESGELGFSTGGLGLPCGPLPPADPIDVVRTLRPRPGSERPRGTDGCDEQAPGEVPPGPDDGSLYTRSLLTSGNARYELIRGLSLTGVASTTNRVERIDFEDRRGMERLVGAGVQYVAPWPYVQPSLGLSRNVGRIETTDDRVGDVGLWTRRAGVSATFGQAFTANADYEDTEATDELFVLSNFRRTRWRASAQSVAHRRLRIEGSWDQSDLELGRPPALINSTQRTVQGGVAWLLGRAQQVSLRYGAWRVGLDGEGVDSRVLTAQYLAQFRRLRALAEYSREALDTARVSGGARITQFNNRVQGYVEYRLRLFTFGFDFRVARSALDPLPASGTSQWRVRIARRFGTALR